MEQFLASEEKVFECRDEQALAEAAGAAEEIYLPLADKVINQCRLVNIDITILTYLLKALYSYWVLHSKAFLLFRWQRYVFLFETQNYPYVFYTKNENESQGQVYRPKRVNQGAEVPMTLICITLYLLK